MSGKIFVSYRRGDTDGIAGRLYDRLVETFGRDNLFMDVVKLSPGIDFVTHLNKQLARCDTFLAIIGPKWSKVKDKAGKRRLHRPDDWVAIEVGAALGRGIRVIPVLVDGAKMPKTRELPNSLKALARLQYIEVRNAHFGRDVEELVSTLQKEVGDEEVPSRGWPVRVAAVTAVVLPLLVVGGYAIFWNSPRPVQPTPTATKDENPQPGLTSSERYGIHLITSTDFQVAEQNAIEAKSIAPSGSKILLYKRKKGWWATVVVYSNNLNASADLPRFQKKNTDWADAQVVTLGNWCPKATEYELVRTSSQGGSVKALDCHQ